jgi:hypothetical protein
VELERRTTRSRCVQTLLRERPRTCPKTVKPAETQSNPWAIKGWGTEAQTAGHSVTSNQATSYCIATVPLRIALTLRRHIELQPPRVELRETSNYTSLCN